MPKRSASLIAFLAWELPQGLGERGGDDLESHRGGLRLTPACLKNRVKGVIFHSPASQPMQCRVPFHSCFALVVSWLDQVLPGAPWQLLVHPICSTCIAAAQLSIATRDFGVLKALL